MVSNCQKVQLKPNIYYNWCPSSCLSPLYIVWKKYKKNQSNKAESIIFAWSDIRCKIVQNKYNLQKRYLTSNRCLTTIFDETGRPLCLNYLKNYLTWYIRFSRSWYMIHVCKKWSIYIVIKMPKTNHCTK